MIPSELLESRGRSISDTRRACLERAYSHLGKVCLWGHKGEDDMFDCSGLVTDALWFITGDDWRATVNAAGLYDKTTPVSHFEASPGDLAFYVSAKGNRERIIHVVFVLGNWRVLSASGATPLITTREGAIRSGASIRLHDSIWYRPGLVAIRRLPQF